MDLDAYTLAHEQDWQRHEELARRRHLSGAEIDELVRLYEATATDLSTVRSTTPDPHTVMRLSQLLGRTRNRLTGTHTPAWREIVRFVQVTFPVVLYRLRWWIVAVMVLSTVVAVATGRYLYLHDDLRATVLSPSAQQEYADSQFAQYYDPGAGFAIHVWTNNAWVTAQCVALGITGIGTVWVLFTNAFNVGAAGAVMAAHGGLAQFFQLLSPHGLLELTAVFVAGAAGLQLFWSWLVPGARPRTVALAESARALFTTTIGLIGVLAVSGAIEGFVTGSALLWWVKTTIGVLALTGFWVYVLTLGRVAARRGETGDLEPDRAGYSLATSA